VDEIPSVRPGLPVLRSAIVAVVAFVAAFAVVYAIVMLQYERPANGRGGMVGLGIAMLGIPSGIVIAIVAVVVDRRIQRRRRAKMLRDIERPFPTARVVDR
jgi:hypothetical protein